MLLISIIALVSIFFASIVLIWHISRGEHPKQDEQSDRSQQGRAQRVRRRQARAAPEANEAAASENERGASSSRRSAKKRAKQARREAARSGEPSLAVVDDVSDAGASADEGENGVFRSAYEVAQEKKADQREAQELAEAEEIRLAQETRTRRERDEFDAWKDLFSMDGTGEDAKSVEQLHSRRREMCARLQAGKVVELETISAEFGMCCNEVIAEIRHLEREGMLTGILDDRGKYIYFSMEELQRLAGVIRSRGRISISAVAQEASAMVRVPTQDAAAAALGEQALDALITA